jgi:ParB family transcriptional regulator, chromosome partitioning protein
MTEAVLEKLNANEAISAGGPEPTVEKTELKSILCNELEFSQTNPRRRVVDEAIGSLANSIRIQGILEPLIVRRAGEKYEIVCGSRRYRAAALAGLAEVPCLVRELSDEQVLGIQIHENLHREDVHPMDEAYGYEFLREKLNCDAAELALRVGKSEGYVLNRLKLNLLIKDAQKDIDNGYLPLAYALEMAKYTPQIQKIIYDEVYKKESRYKGNTYVQVPIKGETVALKRLVEWMNTNIHHLLSKAPFDPKAANLRADGLACINCPDRTGAAASLFEPNQVGKKDACLNPTCFRSKVENHIQVRRKELAELRQVELSEVPIVRSWCYANGKEYLGTESALVISGTKRASKEKQCNKTIAGIDIEADNHGQTVQVCLRTTRCKVHWPESKSSSAESAGDGKSVDAEVAARLESHRARREEIWNAKIAEAVRIRVFKQAAEKFEKKFRITDVGIDLLSQLVAKFWRMSASGDSTNLQGVVEYLVSAWASEQGERIDMHMSDFRTTVEQMKKLNRGMQFRILFLLIYSHKGTIGHNNYYSSQKEVKELAGEFGIDYVNADAEVRLELCAKKHKDVHEGYVAALREQSKNARVPRLFSEKWKPND